MKTVELKISSKLAEKFRLEREKEELDLIVKKLEESKYLDVYESYSDSIKRKYGKRGFYIKSAQKPTTFWEKLKNLFEADELLQRAQGYSFSKDGWKERRALLAEQALKRAKKWRNKISTLLSRVKKCLLLINAADKRAILNKIGIKRIRQLLCVNQDEEEILGLRLLKEFKNILNQKILTNEEHRHRKIKASISV